MVILSKNKIIAIICISIIYITYYLLSPFSPDYETYRNLTTSPDALAQINETINSVEVFSYITLSLISFVNIINSYPVEIVSTISLLGLFYFIKSPYLIIAISLTYAVNYYHNFWTNQIRMTPGIPILATYFYYFNKKNFKNIILLISAILFHVTYVIYFPLLTTYFEGIYKKLLFIVAIFILSAILINYYDIEKIFLYTLIDGSISKVLVFRFIFFTLFIIINFKILEYESKIFFLYYIIMGFCIVIFYSLLPIVMGRFFSLIWLLEPFILRYFPLKHKIFHILIIILGVIARLYDDNFN